MKKICLFLLLAITAVYCKDCFGAECGHISPILSLEPMDPVQVSQIVEKQIKRQYWYFLEKADLIHQSTLNIPGRLIIFYFHRNELGTFFTMGSWNFRDSYTIIHTMVRIGNGYQNNDKNTTLDVSLAVLKLQIDQNKYLIKLDEQGNAILNQLDQYEDKCKEESDIYLRTNYWYFLNQANRTNVQTLKLGDRTYVTQTYLNKAGTFLIMTNCFGEEININYFIKLGLHSNKDNDPNTINPIVLQSKLN